MFFFFRAACCVRVGQFKLLDLKEWMNDGTPWNGKEDAPKSFRSVRRYKSSSSAADGESNPAVASLDRPLDAGP